MEWAGRGLAGRRDRSSRMRSLDGEVCWSGMCCCGNGGPMWTGRKSSVSSSHSTTSLSLRLTINGVPPTCAELLLRTGLARAPGWLALRCGDWCLGVWMPTGGLRRGMTGREDAALANCLSVAEAPASSHTIRSSSASSNTGESLGGRWVGGQSGTWVDGQASAWVGGRAGAWVDEGSGLHSTTSSSIAAGRDGLGEVVLSGWFWRKSSETMWLLIS
jgi:hypothetical protein